MARYFIQVFLFCAVFELISTGPLIKDKNFPLNLPLNKPVLEIKKLPKDHKCQLDVYYMQDCNFCFCFYDIKGIAIWHCSTRVCLKNKDFRAPSKTYFQRL